jgi:Zn-dependent membrane protease YugP
MSGPRMFTAIEYSLYALPALIVTVWAQARIWRAFAEGWRIPASSGLSGAEAAVVVMRAGGLERVAIEPVDGELSDHYDPAHKVLRLSTNVYAGRSLAAVGIAAHEAGHAIQHAKRYRGLVVRSLIVPLAAIGSTFCWLTVLAGLLIGLAGLVLLGILLFSLAVALQIVNLPVEYNASRRSREMLRSTGVISFEEERVVGNVLNAAAWTHVALALTGVLTLRYYLWPFRLMKRRRSVGLAESGDLDRNRRE